ncbi:MAG: hypothetical protein IIX74_00735, partial [Lachnospiraceae bacterium]|nr:hypothetical protein [Lachnospiraceae bacterium]
WPEDAEVAENVTITGEEGTVIAAGEGINKIVATNITVDNVDFTAAKGNTSSAYIALQVIGSGTFKNCNIEGSYGVRMSDAVGDVTFENCVITGEVYAVHFNGSGKADTSLAHAGKVTLDGCTLSGWTSFGNAGGVDIEDCTFVEHEKYNTIRFYQDATIVGTTVNPQTSIEINDTTENVTVTVDSTSVNGKPSVL